MRTARWLALAIFIPWLALWTWRVAVGINNPLAPPSNPIHSAEGYLDTVDLFLRHDWLVFEQDANEGRVVPTFEDDSPMADFYRSSYLERDVEDFNNGDLSVFRVDNGQILSIDPNRHNIVLPFSEVRSWPGLLTYRPESGRSGELRGDGVVIDLSGPTQDIRSRERLPEIVVPPMRVAAAPKESEELRERGEVVNISGQGGAFFGKAHLIGGSILFNNRGYARGTSVSISGESVPPGNRSRLDSGDLLKLRWRRGGRGPSQYALLWGSILGEAPVISAYRAVNGRWRRTPEIPEPRFAGNVIGALNGAFRRRTSGDRYVIPEHRQAEELDLALTLDSQLHNDVQRHLRAYAMSLHDQNEIPFRAAVTVMDATSGELLALASYPTEKDLETWEEGTAAKERLLRNHNFSRLPIGSVAKVMLAAAILEETPALADLKIREYPGGKIDRLLDIDLDPPMEDHSIPSGDGWIDFEEFVEKSSNKYAATLLTLATGTEGGTLRPPLADPDVPEELPVQEQFQIGGQGWELRPNLRLPVVRNTRRPKPGEPPPAPAACGRITTLEFAPYAARLRQIFGLEISRKTVRMESGRLPRRVPGEGDDLLDTSIWLPVLEHLYGGRDAIPPDHSFYSASPERENLAYNLMDSYRQQYLSVVLGGGSSTWTMPRVCEIFSRLVTGRQVEANLVRRIRLWDGTDIEPSRNRNLPPLDMKPGVRRRLVDAMTLVAGPGGTASALRPTLAEIDRRLEQKGKALGFFSKTGSPNNLTFVPSITARAVNALIAKGALRLDSSNRIVYRDSGPVDAERPEDTGRVPSLDALNANSGDMAILRRYGINPRFVIQICDTWNDSRPEDRIQFETRQGKLVRLIRTNEIKSIGGAYAFTMGIYGNSARQAPLVPGSLPRIDVIGHRPERALTVSILVETQGNGPTIAVPFARTLIREVLANALEDGW